MSHPQERPDSPDAPSLGGGIPPRAPRVTQPLVLGLSLCLVAGAGVGLLLVQKARSSGQVAVAKPLGGDRALGLPAAPLPPPTSARGLGAPPPPVPCPTPLEALELQPRGLPMKRLSMDLAYAPEGPALAGSAGSGPAPACSAPGRTVQVPPSPVGSLRARSAEWNTESYDSVQDNPFLAATQQPLSTFSIDVDTASYANVRRFLDSGQTPPRGAVRIEEMINAFEYGYAGPTNGHPFAIHTAVSVCPWAKEHRLLRVGLQGRRLSMDKLPPRNLVFLVDVSGSMQEPNKLPLVKEGLLELVGKLRREDRVSMVVYAGSSGLVLPPTSGAEQPRIADAIRRLEAGGGTHGSDGIRLAYQTARKSFLASGVNRVILATDGDFNVGVTSQDELVRLIEKERESGVFLSVLGFGMGNYKDSTLEKLANKGNGDYAYIDSIQEARKVFRNGGATLVTIAKDVKLQLEFNPAKVSHYRLIGYENRVLAAQDFNDDRKDAGEMGVGHSVTALYELVPTGVAFQGGSVDPLKYQQTAPTASARGGELLTLKCRYKDPEAHGSRLLTTVVEDGAPAPMTDDIRFAASVAAFGMVLRESPHRGRASFGMALALAREIPNLDPERLEYLKLVEKARALEPGRVAQVAQP